jgi:anaerobic selenocysteine-containing dehydrogenase
MGYGEHFPWRTEEEMIEHLLAPSKITLKQLLEQPGGVWYGERSSDMSRKIRTPSGKIELYSQTLADAGYDPIPKYVESPRGFPEAGEPPEKYPLTAVTGVRKPVYSGYQMRNIAQLRKLAPEPMVKIHPDTAQEYEIGDGEEILIETPDRKIQMKARLTEDIKAGLVGIPHGWDSDQNANVLTSMQPNDPVTGYSTNMNHLPCRIRRA